MSIKTFRYIGWAEALSFLVLLGVAMPLKYVWGMPVATKVAGSIHGALFLGYLAVAHALADRENWPSKRLMRAYAAAVIPFGPFLLNHSPSSPRPE